MSKWTRADLPEVPALRQADDERGTGNRSTAFDIALDVVVDHLNRAHPKPEVGGTITYDWTRPDERDDIKTVRSERDELEAANEKLHREWTAEFIRANHAEAERDELRAVFTAEKDELIRLATKEN